MFMTAPCEYIERISRSAGIVNLANGTSLPVQALVTATGFEAKPTLDFSPSSIQADLGIPTIIMTQSQSGMWNDLTSLPTEELELRFPDLMAGPNVPGGIVSTPLTKLESKEMPQPCTPWRLYRGVVPPTGDSDRSIAFSGFRANITNIMRVELTALWIHAYMTHSPTLVLPDAEAR
jgi:hypothetical protein